MACSYLHDPERQRAVLYDTVTETPFGTAFTGADAAYQVRLFIHWLTDDARSFTGRGLDALRAQWHDRFIDPDTGALNDAGHTLLKEITDA